MPSLSTIIGWIGLLLVLHAAYSYRHYKKLILDLEMQDQAPTIPIDVLLELIAGFTAILVARMIVLQLKSITISREIKGKSWEESFSNMSYAVYNHRYTTNIAII